MGQIDYDRLEAELEAERKLFDSYIVHATTRIGLHMYYEALLAEHSERTEFLGEH